MAKITAHGGPTQWLGPPPPKPSADDIPPVEDPVLPEVAKPPAKPAKAEAESVEPAAGAVTVTRPGRRRRSV